ncbi:MAG: nucleotide exchange factor GrpE [Acidiferrobacteraceae bacterium]
MTEDKKPDESTVAGETDSVPETAAAEEGATLEQQLEAARAEAAENLDKFLRASAESENVRRRAQIDVENARKYGIERFATELLAVRDSLDLALQVDLQEAGEALKKMHEGIELTLRQLDTVFQRFSISPIDPAGEKFDPEKHQAMSMVETDELEPNHIVTVVQKGYLLHDRLLRPAMVIVAKAKTATEGENQA